MKKNVLYAMRGMFMTAMALWAVNASATTDPNDPKLVSTCGLYIEDFAVVPGETYQMVIQYKSGEGWDKDGNPDIQYAHNTQFDITLPEGIDFTYTPRGKVKDYFSTERTMPYYEDEPTFCLTVDWKITSSGAHRFICKNTSAGVSDPLPGVDGPYFAINIAVAEDYDGTGVIKITNAQGSDATGAKAYHFLDTEAKVLLATDMKNVEEAAGQVGFAQPLTVVEKIPMANSLIVTDGENNWLRVAAPDAETFGELAKHDVFKPGTVVGEMTCENGNPAIALAKNPIDYNVYTAAGPEPGEPATYMIDECNLEHYDNFRPKANQVIAIQGYFFNGKLRGWSDNSGMSADLDMSWYEGNNSMTQGSSYRIPKAVAQLKSAWDKAAGAPAKMAADDNLYFQNYTLYALDVPELPTAVTELNNDKGVAAVKYVNVAGVESAKPFDGVNIKVTTYSDGSSKAVKVVK